MDGICTPCYELLAKVLPCVEPLVERAKFNRTKWQELADLHLKKAQEGKTESKAGSESGGDAKK